MQDLVDVKKFTWLPLHKEVASWLLQYRNKQPELCRILKEVGFEKNLTDEDKNGKIPLEVMDPISFMAYFQKPKNHENRKRYWLSLINRQGFVSPVPLDFNGLPSAQPMNLWMFGFKKDRLPEDMDNLWDLAEQAIRGELKEKTFNDIFSKKGIGLAKLTQGLFWLNPEKFYPIDAHKSFLEERGINYQVTNLNDYNRVLNDIKETFDSPLYEISYTAWKKSQEEEDEETELTPGSFEHIIKKFEADKLHSYLTFIRTIVKELTLNFEDKRIVFVARKRRLNFSVGNRYAINLFRDDIPNYFGFISDKELPIYDSEFSGSSFAAYYNITDTNTDLNKYRSSILNAIKNELARTKVSKSIKYDNSDFRSYVFEINKNTNQKPAGDKNIPEKGALNRILYGPPGTGKTYLSKRMALSILEEKPIEEINKLYKTPIEISRQFEKYQATGQAVFTTFHQSFSYEDFIEGIKPVLDNESAETGVDRDEAASGKIGYQIKPGIFKQIADRAHSYKASTPSAIPGLIMPSIDLGDKQFFKMSLGNTQKEEDQEIYNYCIENNCIALGWGKNIDFTRGNTNEQIDALFEKNGGARSRYEITAVRCFRLWMNKGDIVLISEGNLQVRAIAQIESDYYFDSKSPISPKHFRKVKWLLKDVRIPVNELYEKQFSQQTIYMLWNEEIKKEFFLKPEAKAFQNPNHVLIIDEINRGNVSAIFGELITLIEEDKRDGRNEAIVANLPYSKKPFSVPDNLYIIGTMNTADRSVEALDAALRRRFYFEEMAPRYDLPALKKEVGGIQFKDLLETINKRLEKLLDKDHKIGHSYFMFQNEIDTTTRLIESFYKNIIPLLQEYFFGDYGKIGLVLGKGFVRRDDANEKLFGEFEYDGVEMLQSKPIYSIIDYRNSNIEGSFESALKTLITPVQ